jgi:diadenosine tetraphosphatase ApaH/serine/threonine PP2A family protein phosphatase
VLCGHTHVPRIVALDDGRVIVNPGSVGLPAYTDDTPVPHANQMGAPYARYAVLERRKVADPWQVSFRVVAYDWGAASKRAADKGRADWARWIKTGYA